MMNFIRDEYLEKIIARKQFVKDQKEKLRNEKKNKVVAASTTALPDQSLAYNPMQSIEQPAPIEQPRPNPILIEEEKVPIRKEKEPKIGKSPL